MTWVEKILQYTQIQKNPILGIKGRSGLKGSRKTSRPATPATVTDPDSELKELAPFIGKAARLLKSKGIRVIEWIWWVGTP